MSNLASRVLSGLIAASLLIAIGIVWKEKGLIAAATVVIIIGLYEFSKLAMKPFQSIRVQALWFWVSALSLFAMLEFLSSTSLAFAIALSIFWAGSLWICREKMSNENILGCLTYCTMGLIVCVLAPHFAIELLQIPLGLSWFIYLLVVVFFGDTGAYFGGSYFGKRKLMPSVSPKKTIEGAFAGLVSSCVASMVACLLLGLPAPIWAALGFGLVCGFVAQSGDLLFSLMKRVSHVKDSGAIMPGHGGVLDRIDGILVACPLVYGFALYWTT